VLAPRADAPPQDIAITFDDLVFLGNPTVARREQRSGEAAGSAEATKDVAQKPSEERLTTFTFVLVIRSGCRSMQRWREAARAADNVFRFEQQRIGYVSAETQRFLLAVPPTRSASRGGPCARCRALTRGARRRRWLPGAMGRRGREG